jgi:phosphocarrier protein HPr
VIRRHVEIMIKEGVHLRVATAIVELASQRQSEVIFEHEAQEGSARSAIELLALGLVPGAEVELRVSGPDEAQVMTELSALLGAEDSPHGS